MKHSHIFRLLLLVIFLTLPSALVSLPTMKPTKTIGTTTSASGASTTTSSSSSSSIAFITDDTSTQHIIWDPSPLKHALHNFIQVWQSTKLAFRSTNDRKPEVKHTYSEKILFQDPPLKQNHEYIRKFPPTERDMMKLVEDVSSQNNQQFVKESFAHAQNTDDSASTSNVRVTHQDKIKPVLVMTQTEKSLESSVENTPRESDQISENDIIENDPDGIVFHSLFRVPNIIKQKDELPPCPEGHRRSHHGHCVKSLKRRIQYRVVIQENQKSN